MAELSAEGKAPEVLFWVGCAGSYDERYKKVTRAIVNLLNIAEVDFGVLGPEETCTGDPARRAGNEFLFQMQALSNIQLFDSYQIKKILTACPHCFNTFKNEYPELGGSYEVFHHSTFLSQLLKEGRLSVKSPDKVNALKLTYHDSCYLGRSNNIYNAPRDVIEAIGAELTEMSENKKNGMCCGAGGAQLFKEPEAGNTDVNLLRTEQALNTGANTIATACPFCMTMMSDGLKDKGKEEDIKVVDIAELLLQANNSPKAKPIV